MEITNATQLYAKHYIPLESNPSVLNDLMYGLGVSGSLTLTDVWEINDPIQLSLIPRLVLALILVLPTSEKYESHRRSANVSTDTAEDPMQESVVWLRQIINNACGLYAILHAICNIEKRELGLDTFVEQDNINKFISIVEDATGKKRRLQLELAPITRQRAIVYHGTSCFRALFFTLLRLL